MVVKNTLFFGYGSLVNLATHNYPFCQKATVHGWCRKWETSSQYAHSFLSVDANPNAEICGIVADASEIGWAELDIREKAYNRFELNRETVISDQNLAVEMYQADPAYVANDGSIKPILLSYLDCVIQGFNTHFGEQGVADFFASTKQWNRPIKNDRLAPIYPRAQQLTDYETQLVDAHLEALMAVVQD